MPKKRKWLDLTTDLPPVGPVAPVEPAGPVAPVRRGGRTRYLQDGRWLPSWRVWLRRRRVLLAMLAVAAVIVAIIRSIGGAK